MSNETSSVGFDAQLDGRRSAPPCPHTPASCVPGEVQKHSIPPSAPPSLHSSMHTPAARPSSRRVVGVWSSHRTYTSCNSLLLCLFWLLMNLESTNVPCTENFLTRRVHLGPNLSMLKVNFSYDTYPVDMSLGIPPFHISP